MYAEWRETQQHTCSGRLFQKRGQKPGFEMDWNAVQVCQMHHRHHRSVLLRQELIKFLLFNVILSSGCSNIFY